MIDRNSLLKLSALIVCLAGCSSNSVELAAVSGTLTDHEGNPVSGAEVEFMPVELNAGAPSMGVTDDQGKYTLRYNIQTMGAVPGKHQVMIRKSNSGPPPAEDGSGEVPGPPPTDKGAISLTLPAQVDVVADQENEIALQLPSEKEMKQMARRPPPVGN